jgi:hypothetical protein
MPELTAPLHTGGKKQLFFAKIYFSNVANLPKSCNVTLTVMITMPRRCSTQQAACWYRLLTADQGTGSDPSFCFVVKSRVESPKEHKINKKTYNV